MSGAPQNKREKPQEQLTRSVLQFIRTYVDQHGYSPSMREIGEACHIGRTTVVRYLDCLEVQGHLRHDLGVALGRKTATCSM